MTTGSKFQFCASVKTLAGLTVRQSGSGHLLCRRPSGSRRTIWRGWPSDRVPSHLRLKRRATTTAPPAASPLPSSTSAGAPFAACVTSTDARRCRSYSVVAHAGWYGVYAYENRSGLLVRRVLDNTCCKQCACGTRGGCCSYSVVEHKKDACGTLEPWSIFEAGDGPSGRDQCAFERRGKSCSLATRSSATFTSRL